MRTALLVSAGGALGAMARSAITGAPAASFETELVLTGLVNLVGSLLLAIAVRRVAGDDLRAFLGPGVLGGFTTMSAAAVQTQQLLADERFALAASYAAGSTLACLAGVALAWRVVR